VNDMTDHTHDLNAWLDTYAFTAFTKAQQDWLKALERFAVFNFTVAGDVLEASLAQARATLGVRTTLGAQALADLLQKQAELGAQLGERLRARAQEFSDLASEVQQSVGTFAHAAAQRTSGAKKAA
jgi:hypothetical protein